MEKEFVPYDQGLELKELGFDEPCLNRFYTKSKSKMFALDEKGGHYPIRNTSKKLYTLGEHFVLNEDNAIIAPLYQQAFRWFRKNFKLYSTIMFRLNMEDNNEYWDWLIKGENVVYKHFKTYEEAELACLIKLIEILKSKQITNNF